MKSNIANRIITLLVFFGIISSVNAQGLPPIFEKTPEMLLTHKTVQSFPEKTFLENIAINAQDELFITSHYEGIIYKVIPDGVRSVFAKVNGKLTGLVFDSKGNLIVTAFDEKEKAAIYQFDKKGGSKKLLVLPDAQFLNGIASLTNNQYLIADSYKGCIWLYDATKNTASIWLSDPLLAHPDVNNPTPGVNGIKVKNKVVYASNTQQKQLITIPILAGNKAGKPKLFLKDVNIDDFVIADNGIVYATTHIYNRFLKITPDKSVTIIGGLSEGMAGCTAVALGRGKANQKNLYITTNGGMSYPPASGIEIAKIVRISLP